MKKIWQKLTKLKIYGTNQRAGKRAGRELVFPPFAFVPYIY